MAITACQTLPDNNLLDAGARQHIKKVDGVLIAKQDRIGADIERTNPELLQIGTLLTGSILPILFDVGVTSARAAEANKLAKPMRENLKGYDYAWDVRKHVKQSLEGTTLDEFDNFMILREEFPGLRGRLIRESQADAVLTVDMKYGFTPKFDKLYVASYAVLFPNKAELKQFQERPDRDNELEFSDNIYRNQFAVSLSTDLPGASKEENAAYWAKLTEEELVQRLERAALVLADTIANDVSLDDLDSDLDLVPEDYILNTEYSNLNTLKNRDKDAASPDATPDSNDFEGLERAEPEEETTLSN